MGQIPHRLRHCFGTEDNPADNSEEEGKSHLKRFFDAGQETAIGNNMLIFGVDAEEIIDGKQRGVEQTPTYEGPVGTVP